MKPDKVKKILTFRINDFKVFGAVLILFSAIAFLMMLFVDKVSFRWDGLLVVLGCFAFGLFLFKSGTWKDPVVQFKSLEDRVYGDAKNWVDKSAKKNKRK